MSDISHAAVRQTYALLIGGELQYSALGVEVIDPATRRAVATAPRASLADVDRAVAAARLAFPGWRDTSIAARREAVTALSSAIREAREELAEVLVAEQGKPYGQALDEVDLTCAFIEAFCRIDISPEVLYEDGEHFAEAHYRPLGVVAGIAPWNFPLFLMMIKLASAVLTGNTFVAKPAPSTPLSMLVVGRLACSIFPAGVVNVLSGGSDIGPRLVEHSDVAKISFTGSTGTGRRIAASAAATLKSVSLELGGNDVALVLAGADPRTVAQALFESAFLNAGQVCVAVKRVYADAEIYDALCDELSGLAEAAVIGAGGEPGVTLGPVQNAAQFAKAQDYLQHARTDGRITVGGGVRDVGYFVEPTIVRDISSGSRLVQEEQFAPILPVVRFHDLDATIAEINESKFGLGGSVWSSDENRAAAVARRLETGTVWINHHLGLHPLIPVGGAKESGSGIDYGIDGMKQYMQRTVIRRKTSS